MKKLAILAIVALGLSAIGATQYTKLLNLQVRGYTLLGTTTESNVIGNSIVADVDFDFPAATIVCNDSNAVTATGVNKGDPCFVGIGPRDGGVQVTTANSVFQAYSDADDSVKVRHCAVGTAANPADAGYVVRCFSSSL